jgi:hypothetical protein
MRIRSFVVTGVAVCALSVVIGAQQVIRPATPPVQVTPVQVTAEPVRRVAQGPAPLTPPQLTNIRFEVTLTETGSTPMKRTVTMLVADGSRGALRSSGASVNNVIPTLNVDVRPRIERNGLIRATFVIEYKRSNSLSFEPLLESGKSMVVFEAPELSDSTTTVTVTATIVR